MEIIKKKYRDFSLYFYKDKFFEIGKKIIDNEIETLKILKDTKRNYVSLVAFENNKYVLKEARNEFRIPQRKFMTLFKRGEALNTLMNVNKMIYKYDFKEYIEPFLAIVKRKNGFIVYSALVLEYSNGQENRDFLSEIVLKMKKVHSLGYYHGDFNPSNFLVEENKKIRILDTQAKKMFLTNYRAHYDMLTMKIDSYPEMIYPYSKNIFYFLALSVKKIKKLKFVEWIKLKKKTLRNKGWKI